MHAAVFGADYDHGTLKSETIESGKQTLEKWAVYANDTITYKAFTATPGIRYDHTSTNGDFWSPSLGLRWRVHDTTILRGYIARGFSIPPLSTTFGRSGTSDIEEVVRPSNPNLEVEKVNAYQVGVESTVIPYLWFKGTLFRYDVSNGWNIMPPSITAEYFHFTAEILVPVLSNDDEIIANKFNLEQNYPNPFNPSTTINYTIAERSTVSLKVYDVLGNEVANLVNTTQEAGKYDVTFNASELSSGLYIYTLNTGNFTSSKKMMLLK